MKTFETIIRSLFGHCIDERFVNQLYYIPIVPVVPTIVIML